MKSTNICYRIGILCFLVFILHSINTSGQELSKDELEKQALDKFSVQQYSNASGDFKVLHEMFPKEPGYAYYLGRSFLHANQNLDSSAELLKFAATRNYGDDTYFFLGQAYHKLYRFEDAYLAFSTFKKTANNRYLKKYNVDYWLDCSNNANESVTNAQKLNIKEKETIPNRVMESAFMGKLNGNYIYLPEQLKSKADISKNYQTLIYLPAEYELGEFLYFASYSGTNESTDLYRVKRLTAENFSLPEKLSASVNTEYDEDYPFYDKSTGTLYFSSKGHNSSGEFDIFLAKYDSTINEWENPEKLNFPINSTHNDILYTVYNNGQEAIFLSDRLTGRNEVTAFTIDISGEKDYINPGKYEEVIALSVLNPEVTEQITRNNETRPELLPVEETENPAVNYEQILAEGLVLQSESDSLLWLERDIRKKIDNEENYQKKQELIANATVLNMESKRIQQLANNKFLQAEELRKKEEENLTSNILQPSASRNGITMYEYNIEEPVSIVTDNNDYSEGLKAAKSLEDDLPSFSILGSSPYSDENPIPVAKLPSGLIYRIQLGAYINPVPESTFKGLTPVTAEKSGGSTKYHVGYFTSVKEAKKALGKIKDYGFADAFIVSYFNNEKIPIQEARKIEFAEK
ncbi:MAG: SPOR domain-containing protein [Bacteroidales bacterium]|nr:SPOR domain-containing protein [Bacteroidales bacterium]